MISKKEFEYTVGRNLAKYRNEKKLTQMQVAEMAELSVPFYASVELVYPNYLLMFHLQIWQKRQIIDSVKSTIWRCF